MPECSGSALDGGEQGTTASAHARCCGDALPCTAAAGTPRRRITEGRSIPGFLQVECDALAACGENPSHRHRGILAGVMGSKLTRQRSLDLESKLSKRRRQRNDIPGESERGGGGDFLFTSLMLKSDKLPGMLRKTNHSPYVRRVAWIREIQRLLREQKMEQAAEVLKLLRKVKDWYYFGS